MKRSLEFLPQVDGLRFVAVMGVILHHWCQEYLAGSFFFTNIPIGTGVNLFFVISGFLITFILLGKKDDIAEGKSTVGEALRNFFVRRTLRIFPIYYLFIVILCITSFDEIRDYVAALFTYTSNWYIVINKTYIGSLTHTWSLAVEEQFYLIWPFLLFLVPRRRVLAMIVVFILIGLASRIWFFFFTSYPMAANGATTSCFDSLGFGALIAYNRYYNIIPFNIRWASMALWGSVLVYVALYIWPHWLSAQWTTVSFNTATSLIYFLMVYMAAYSGFAGGWKAFLEHPTVLYLGRISYGLYLYHNLPGEIHWYHLRDRFPEISGPFDSIVIYAVILLILATVSWYLIEQPILKLKRRFQ